MVLRTRLRKGEGENLANVKAHLGDLRNDVTEREAEALAQAVVTANENKSPNLEYLKELFRNIHKRVFAPEDVPRSYIEALSIPYCS